MAEHPSLIPTPWSQRVADFKRRQLPLIVWSAAALTVGLMLLGRGTRLEYVGLAQALTYEISTPATGRLNAVLVDLYDEVQAGDVLVRLDDSEVSARVDRARATVEQLRAQLNAAKVLLLATNAEGRADWTNNLRRFQTDEEERRLSMLELRATIEAGEIEEERLALELERASPSAGSGLISDGEFDSIRLRHSEVSQRNNQSRMVLGQTEQEYLAAQARRRGFEAQLPSLPEEEPFLQPLRAAIEVETRRLEEIQVRRQALVLRSPVTGQVNEILCRDGQSVVPGEPILTVTEPSVREIVTYLAEGDRRVVRHNDSVLVSSAGRPDRVAESFVVRTGPTVEMLPQRLWLDPTVPSYGRAVVIAAIPALDLAPGELISVRFDSSR